MVNSRADYTADAVEAARSVMLELVRLLGEYRDDMVIIGGWVPNILLPAAGTKHIGSTDVDLAVNHRKITDAGYRSILEHLTKTRVCSRRPTLRLLPHSGGGRTRNQGASGSPRWRVWWHREESSAPAGTGHYATKSPGM